jgi:hypothetical protein
MIDSYGDRVITCFDAVEVAVQCNKLTRRRGSYEAVLSCSTAV